MSDAIIQTKYFMKLAYPINVVKLAHFNDGMYISYCVYGNRKPSACSVAIGHFQHLLMLNIDLISCAILTCEVASLMNWTEPHMVLHHSSLVRPSQNNNYTDQLAVFLVVVSH